MIRAKKGDIVIINPFEYHANVLAEGEEAVYHLLCVNLSRIFSGKLFETDFILDSRLHMKFKNLITDDGEMREYADALFPRLKKTIRFYLLEALFRFFLHFKTTSTPMRMCQRGRIRAIPK